MCVFVAQSYLTLWDLVDCSPKASLSMEFSKQEYWSGLPFPSPRGSSWPRDQTQISCIAGGFFTVWATRKLLFSYSIFIFSFPPFYFPSSLFSFSVSLHLLWLSPSIQGHLVPGLWQQLSLASFTLLSIQHSVVVFSHRVSFHNLTQTLLLLCATPSSSFSSHWEQSVALTIVQKALCVNCLLANCLIWLHSTF